MSRCVPESVRLAPFAFAFVVAPFLTDVLASLALGAGSAASGPTNTLFFTAGPDHESHGLLGTLVVK